MFIANSFGQETFQQADLVKKKWKRGEYIKTGISEKYTNNKKKFVNRNCPLEIYYYYYLSDTIDTVFDMSKVGNSSSGRYIITKDSERDNIIIDEILFFTDNTLILRMTPCVSPIGGSSIDIYHTRDWYKKKNTEQQTFQLSDIAGKKWQRDTCVGKGSFSIEYINTVKCIDKSVYGKEEKISESEYYLSDTIDTVFNKSKVGKISSGRYIIQRDREGYLYIYEILKLTDSRLILKYLNGTYVRVYGPTILPFHLVEE